MSPLFKALTNFIELKITREKLISWVDTNASFQTFIEEMKKHYDPKKYKIVHFQGSFLESILDLNEIMQNATKPNCLVYIPYIPEDEIINTPFLEVIKSSYSIPSNPSKLLDASCSGFLSPEQLKKCKSVLPGDFNKMESSLLGDIVDASFFDTPESIIEFTKQLLSSQTTILDYDEKHPKGILKELQNGLERTFGFLPNIIDETIDDRILKPAREKEDHSIFRLPLALFLLGREYVMDLNQARPDNPTLIQLQDHGNTYLDTIHKVLNDLRDEAPEFYKGIAKEVEETGIFRRETEVRLSIELGEIDTLPFEDEIHQKEAIRFLFKSEFQNALKVYNQRENSFWKKNDKGIEKFWNWIAVSSQLGKKIDESKTTIPKTKTLEEILNLYSKELYLIDREYRIFCESTSDLIRSSNQKYNDISIIRKNTWNTYSDWLIFANDHYQEICRLNGYLPKNPHDQQRFFFQNHLFPMISTGKTAVFFVDAMRYEIGEMLKESLTSWNENVEILPIYAELPTITSVGMNALVPSIKQDGLEPLLDSSKKTIRGFRSGSRNVTTIKERQILLEEFSKKSLHWISLDDVFKNSKEQEPYIKSKDLIAIHSLEIDKAGENGFLEKGFDFFDATITKIKHSIEKLNELGVENFAIISDHGFIQYDMGSDHSRSESKNPSNFGGLRRFTIQDDYIQSTQYTYVKMDALGYANTQDYLIFLREPKIFKDAPANNGFFHGGNSLQERIIPLIKIQTTAKLKNRKILEKYEIQAEIILGTDKHKLNLVVKEDSGSLVFNNRISLLLEFHQTYDSRVRIVSSNAEKFVSNELELMTNKDYTVEFEVLNTSQDLFKSKDSLRIWCPNSSLEIDEWISDIKVPLVDYVKTNSRTTDRNTSEVNSANINLPSDIDEDVRDILNQLLNSPQKMITEMGIIRKIGESRKAQRAIRQFTNFHRDRKKELEFTIHVSYGAEGTIYKWE